MNYGARKLLAVLAATCTFVLAGAVQAYADCPNADTIPTAENLEDIRAAFICLHNEERAKGYVPALRSDARLTAAATKHAQDMVTNGFFSHDTPTGLNPFDRMRAERYIGRKVAWNASETIAWAVGPRATPRSVMSAWLDATSQRLTLLAPDFRDIGVGIALGAPVPRAPGSMPAVTYTVDYGWRTSMRSLRRCLRKAERKRRSAVRRALRTKCHGL